ncbi:MAG: rhomboid family intramembrane serine protease [Deltaproteobacteria bacterium]|nr:rhomboid family intramembrane serine protease [Deltaproteobacteria bacterium]
MEQRTSTVVPDTSLGFMVAVHEAASHEEANRLVEVLNTRAIPALVQSRELGVSGLITPAGERDIWILVPQSMRLDALSILDQQRDAIIRAEALALLSRAREAQTLPRAWPPPPLPRPSLVPAGDEVDEDDTLREPIDAPAAALSARVLAAALGIGGGVLAQRLLESGLGDRAYRLLAVSPNHPDEWWRLVTAGFLHSGLAHFAMNGLFALILGSVLFGTHGFGAVIATWVLTSAAGLFAEMSFTPAQYVLGASAGIYGLIGLWWGGQSERARRAVLPRRERWRAAGVIVLLIPGALTPFTSSGGGVAVLAHLFGFLVGRGLSMVFRRRFVGDDLVRTRWISNAGLAFASIIVVAAWSLAIPSLVLAR